MAVAPSADKPASAGEAGDSRQIQDLVLDYFLYAPLGVAVTVVEELPKWAAKGRSRATGQIRAARVVGKLAVREGRRRLEKAGQAGRRSGGTAREPSAAGGPASAPVAESVAVGHSEVAGRAAREPRSKVKGPKAASSNGHRTAAPPPPASDLVIPGYDTLAASQVVQRLSSLTPDELEAIRAYEAATRGRRTILHRISQLAAGPSGSPAQGSRGPRSPKR